MAIRSVRAEGPITRPDIRRVPPITDEAKRLEEVDDDRETPTLRPPPPRPSERPSLVRLKGRPRDLPYAVVDVVTADGTRDKRRE